MGDVAIGKDEVDAFGAEERGFLAVEPEPAAPSYDAVKVKLFECGGKG